MGTRRRVRLRTLERDRRVAEVNGRRFEVVTSRNTRGNITGYGIFERYDRPRPSPSGVLLHGEWKIPPGRALLGECRDWLDAEAARG